MLCINPNCTHPQNSDN
ncbi:4-Cys prefix domain-containing protein [Crocosphaera sp. XPORK-15E]